MNHRVKTVRETLGLSQSEFASSLAMNQTGVSMVESGRREVSPALVLKICSVFGVNEHWLRTGEGEPFPLPPQEDLDLQDALMMMGADDIEPWRKKLTLAAVELIANLPEDIMPHVRDFLRKANDAFEETKKDEE